MGGDVSAGDRHAVPLHEAAREIARLGQPLHMAAARSRADVPREEFQHIGDRAVFDRDAAVHVGLTELQVRIPCNLERDMFVVEAQNQWEARAVAHFAFMAGAVDENQAAGLDDEP